MDYVRNGFGGGGKSETKRSITFLGWSWALAGWGATEAAASAASKIAEAAPR